MKEIIIVCKREYMPKYRLPQESFAHIQINANCWRIMDEMQTFLLTILPLDCREYGHKAEEVLMDIETFWELDNKDLEIIKTIFLPMQLSNVGVVSFTNPNTIHLIEAYKLLKFKTNKEKINENS